jgi:ABC-type multidrug transport system ATPase subunit/pSer/pThr/pTyr-binding forkhead associated (FHA) protein
MQQDDVQLVVRWMGGSTQEFELNKPVIVVGRAPGNDVVINHPAVSGRHLSLEITPTGYRVTDLNSTNGTIVNGQRIQPNAAQAVNVNDVLKIGDLTGNWVNLGFKSKSGEALRQLSLGKLDLSNLTNVVIGRDPSSYLPLNHPTVSSRHAMIFKQGGGLMIRDLGSTNGTFVNGQRITQAPLKSGDTIQIGPFKLTYDAQQQSLAQSMGMGHRIDTIKLGREVANKKMILQDVTMTVNPGEFIALVGGSGAGKSTLMKAMNGYEPANHGHILLDGEPLYGKLDMYRTQMGYVPQDDIIHRALPVRLALWYAAKLRMPDARPAEIEARIQDALRAVDLVEHASKPVRLLSGGQRKRVSIAVELLARPTLFFLDEPTSGLDPGLEKKMMYDLNRLADEGRTVVLVTHATANIEQCDQVAFMSYGRLAYYGPPDDALKFYNVRDFSDIYIKLSQDIDPAKGKAPPPELQQFYSRYQKAGRIMAGVVWADAYRQSPYFQKYVADRQSQLKAGAQAMAGAAPPPRRARDSFVRQAFILARRQFDLIRLDLRTLFILLLMMPMIGALFGMVSTPGDLRGIVESKVKPGTMLSGPKADIEKKLKEILKDQKKDKTEDYLPLEGAQMLVVMLSLALTQGGTFAAAYEIVKERAIFRRERAVNLKVTAYVLSKFFILGMFAIVQVAGVLMVLALFGVDLDISGAYFTDNGALELFVTFYLAILASISLGLFISALVPSTDVVLYAILVQLFVQIILGGALFPADLPLISKGTVSYWTTVAVGSTVNMPELNDKGMTCQVIEFQEPQQDGSTLTKKSVECNPAKTKLYPGGTDAKQNGDYAHTAAKMEAMWAGLIFHIIFWLLLTIIMVYRQKGE